MGGYYEEKNFMYNDEYGNGAVQIQERRILRQITARQKKLDRQHQMIHMQLMLEQQSV